MRVWPNQLFIDFAAMLEKYPHLDLENFAALWLAAEALAEDCVALGIDVEDVPLLDPDDHDFPA